MITVGQCARESGLSEAAVRAAIRRGELQATMIGQSYAIEEGDLENWLEDQDDDPDDEDGEDEEDAEGDGDGEDGEDAEGDGDDEDGKAGGV